MKKVVQIPEGVEVKIDGMKVSVSGKNKLERDFYDQTFAKSIKIIQEDGKFVVSCDLDKRKIKAFVGMVAAHVRNMIKGTQNVYTYKLKVCYVHFPMTVKVEGNVVMINNFLGERQSRQAEIMDGVKVEVKKDDISVISADKEKAGQTAARIETATKITSRDRRVYQDGIFITEKPK